MRSVVFLQHIFLVLNYEIEVKKMTRIVMMMTDGSSIVAIIKHEVNEFEVKLTRKFDLKNKPNSLKFKRLFFFIYYIFFIIIVEFAFQNKVD